MAKYYDEANAHTCEPIRKSVDRAERVFYWTLRRPTFLKSERTDICPFRWNSNRMEAEIDQQGGPLQGPLKDEYDPNAIYFFAVNLIWKF